MTKFGSETSLLENVNDTMCLGSPVSSLIGLLTPEMSPKEIKLRFDFILRASQVLYKYVFTSVNPSEDSDSKMRRKYCCILNHTGLKWAVHVHKDVFSINMSGL